jgi:hypothetical protein
MFFKFAIMVTSFAIAYLVSFYKAFVFSHVWTFLAKPFGWELPFSTVQIFVIFILWGFIQPFDPELDLDKEKNTDSNEVFAKSISESIGKQFLKVVGYTMVLVSTWIIGMTIHG